MILGKYAGLMKAEEQFLSKVDNNLQDIYAA